MASATSGIAKMIVQYDWILENVEEEPQTFASKMILFRGERVFRVGLKNHVTSPVLFFMAVDLNKMGMKVRGVTYGIQDSGICPTTMMQMKQEIISDGSLQFFNVHLEKQVTGNCTFLFRICLEGSVPGFSYRLSDRLAKDQLWDSTTVKSQNWADVEFLVMKNIFEWIFSAHKAILAARSPIFAALFTKEQQGNGQPVRIQINGVEPSTVEQFLHFIYTGEPMGTYANEELLRLAEQYQLTTLASLCRTALEKIKPMQMVKLATNLNKENEILSSKIRPDKETEIFFDRTTPTFRCAFSINLNWSPLSVMKYQNEDIFFVVSSKKRAEPGIAKSAIPYSFLTLGVIDKRATGLLDSVVHEPTIHFLCPNLCSFGLKVEDVYFSTPKPKDSWCKMESKNLKNNIELQRFTKQPSPTLPLVALSSTIYFDVKIISTIDNYYYEMMDDAWMTDFWTAATEEKLTDVEIFVGTVKVMEAHRVLLSARSPVLNAAFSEKPNTDKTKYTFEAELDVDIVKLFLQFLYTGSLETSAVHKQLLKLATIFEVNTLKNMCQQANRAPPDVEAFTNSLLEL